MEITFYKYQGTGNDFVMIDDRTEVFPEGNLALVQRLCDRKFGIGADGLILIRNKEGYDFEMVYFNADGSQSMCGNGARCAVAFSKYLGIISDQTHFMAIDGPHEAKVSDQEIELGMSPVTSLANAGQDFFVDTGSPHHVRFVEDVDSYAVVQEGASIRNAEMYQPNGTNVNFVTPIAADEIHVRTYERGVEDETLSCGTGVTACALVYGYQNELHEVKIKTPGGNLKVRFSENAAGSFQNIRLIGPAEQVYQGKININH
ncbi:diaminopimelate epimerase [Cecembia lonarensis]|uniref:Diaminopimelate epimerase n=1 Tax=Cecembia lonarensis (strain CCUG 58316 / KCTC 22772 / LW9) TaxID=1225176 RepID=K1L370_CECL9|nr:diaminopimelate epimerase [Cecembia lonarensis]EKB50835.1 Diaminopimelate epimerase [Cecembia lonarensis LW9]